MQAVSVTVTDWGMPVSSGRILLILEAAVSCDGTGLVFEVPPFIADGDGGCVLPATMSWEKAKMWPSSAVLLAYVKGSFLMPQRTMMWRVV